MDSTITMAAALVPMLPLSRKKSGTPMRAPPPKQTSCLLVRLNMTLVLTLAKSLGTGTYATESLLSQWALKMDFAIELVLNRVKQSNTV